ncbi:hypothetical protein GC252_23245 [Escherichia coli]|nr:hypothetical protein [Escherichia coli]
MCIYLNLMILIKIIRGFISALYEFNNPDQLKIPLPHKHIASTFNDIMSKDVGYAYVSLLYACPLKTHSLRLNPFSK